MSIRQLTISDFAAHCVDEIRAVENGGTVVELIRDGKIIAIINPVAPGPTTGTFGDCIGTGAGFILAPGVSLDEPTWTPEEWEGFPDDAKP